MEKRSALRSEKPEDRLRRNHAALVSIGVGIWEWNISSGALDWSRGIYHLFGLDPFSVIPTYERFLQAVYPEDRDIVIGGVSGAVEHNARYDVEHRVLWPDGTVRWLRERGQVEHNDLGKAIRMTGIVEDITERKDREEELRKTKEAAESAAIAKSRFLANMSHEIRTPMNSVLGFLDIALENPVIPEEVAEYLTTARKSAASLLDLINDILDISKIEAGEILLENVQFHLPRLLKETLSLLKIKAQEKGLKIDLHVHPELFICIQSDPTRIRQILVNLLSNAVKFTAKGGISVKVEPEGENALHFTVADTGIGLKKDQFEKIFKPFMQADETTTRKYGGSGLGTTISKQLVELMGGRIWVESPGEGRGTSFHFIISHMTPVCSGNCAADCEAHGKPGEIVVPQSKRKFRILIAEDVEANATLASLRLKQQGHRIKHVWNGKEVVDAYIPGEFDLLLMDVQMPEMDGLEAARIIRGGERNNGARIPIIALTASVMPEDYDICIKAGMDRVVGKPIDFNELFKIMEELVPEGVGEKIEDVEISLKENRTLDLSGLESIDVEGSLKRWRDPEIFVQQIIGFNDSYSTVKDNLYTLIKSRKIDEAHRLAHSVKGVAGNLGITQVFKAASALNDLLKTAVDTIDSASEQVKIHLETLGLAFEELKPAIEKVRTLVPQTEKAEVSFNKEKTGLLLKQLREKLKEYNPESVEPVLTELRKMVAFEQLVPVQEAISEFSFDKAEAVVANLESFLKISPEGKNG